MVAYVFDEDLRDQTNRSRQNYWDTYLQEICGLLGLNASPLSLADLEDSDRLQEVSALLIGQVSGARLIDTIIGNLEQWVKRGGILIGFGVKGLDQVFGIEPVSEIKQKPDDYALAGYFHLRPHAHFRCTGYAHGGDLRPHKLEKSGAMGTGERCGI